MSENQTVATVETIRLTRGEKLLNRAAVLLKRIETDTDAYNAIKAELESAEALRNIAVGSIVTIKLGRKFADKDTTRFVEAVVLGVREEEDGSVQYKVQHGSGFDAEVCVVGAGSISLPVPEVHVEDVDPCCEEEVQA